MLRGLASKKDSILSRIDMAKFQSSTKVCTWQPREQETTWHQRTVWRSTSPIILWSCDPSHHGRCQRPRVLPQVEAVREELARMKARDPGAKAIVFSQFTSMLDILHFRLTQARCDRCAYCPSASVSASRQSCVRAFKDQLEHANLNMAAPRRRWASSAWC